MNYVITTNSIFSSALPSASVLVVALGGRVCTRYECEDSIFRAAPFAWDLSLPEFAAHQPAFSSLVGLCAEIETARLAAEADRLANPPPPQPWRVSKDTMISRVVEAGALPAVITALDSQPASDQFVFTQSAWFWSTNETLRGLCTALGLDPDAILAPDPYL